MFMPLKWIGYGYVYGKFAEYTLHFEIYNSKNKQNQNMHAKYVFNI